MHNKLHLLLTIDRIFLSALGLLVINSREIVIIVVVGMMHVVKWYPWKLVICSVIKVVRANVGIKISSSPTSSAMQIIPTAHLIVVNARVVGLLGRHHPIHVDIVVVIIGIMIVGKNPNNPLGILII
jgi:hypothetical protein